MSQDWADKIAQQLLGRDLIQKGICLVLGAADTGKTALVAALAKRSASNQPVGIIDADIGQSHIGPPTTVGWAIADSSQSDFSHLEAGGISFVGDVTPTGHLLQLTAAIVQCTRQVSELSDLTIIDTPGFINGPTAAALWWTVQQLLQPELILVVQRNDELTNILTGLKSFDCQIERIKSPPQILTKSPQNRRSYRQSQFAKYFRDSCLYDISLGKVAVQPGRNLYSGGLVNRLVALRDKKAADVAIGLITQWKSVRDVVVVKAPKIDIQQIRCLIIGDVSIEVPDE